MKIIDESKMFKNNFSIDKVKNMLLSEDFRNKLNEIYGIQNNNPFESSVNSISVSTDLCQAINEVIERGCSVASPLPNTENILINFNNEKLNITEGCIIEDKYIPGFIESYVTITPSSKYHEVANMIRENYSFCQLN